MEPENPSKAPPTLAPKAPPTPERDEMRISPEDMATIGQLMTEIEMLKHKGSEDNKEEIAGLEAQIVQIFSSGLNNAAQSLMLENIAKKGRQMREIRKLKEAGFEKNREKIAELEAQMAQMFPIGIKNPTESGTPPTSTADAAQLPPQPTQAAPTNSFN